MKLSDDFNLTNDMMIELIEFFSWYPVLTMDTGASRLDRKLLKVFARNLETQHITGAAISRVPIAGNLDGIFLFKHWIEYWLLG